MESIYQFAPSNYEERYIWSVIDSMLEIDRDKETQQLNLIELMLQIDNEKQLQQLFLENQNLIDENLISSMLRIAKNSENKSITKHIHALIDNTDFLYVYNYNFLMDLLKLVDESGKGYKKAVDVFLRFNLHRISLQLIPCLYNWWEYVTTNLDSETQYDLVDVVFNLGSFLTEFQLKTSDCLEIAIECYYCILSQYSLEYFFFDWVITQHNLGLTYIRRIRGNKSDNLEQAIECYQNILLVLQKHPEFGNTELPKAQMNLGLAYNYRIKGDLNDNLKKAIQCYKNALSVWTRENNPLEWARVQVVLGSVYSIIGSDQQENFKKQSSVIKMPYQKKAIKCYKNALSVCTRENYPLEWAGIQLSRGSLYSIGEGNERENSEKAIQCYEKALLEFKQEVVPLDWAMTQNGLGWSYSQRIRGDKVENLERAIAFYHNALTVYTKANDPLNCLNTARNLADLHYDEKQWQSATEAYNLAIEAVENARLEALNPQSKAETLSNAIDVFHRIVQAHLKLNQPEKALEYVERSKGRNLVELMTQKNLQPQGVSQEIIKQLNELKQRVVSEQIRLQSQRINQNLMRSDNLTPYVQDHSYLKEYQQELDDFIEREIKDPLFSLTQKVEPIPFTEIQSLTDTETCLLQWYITRAKILAFVVSAGGEVKVWQSSEDDVKQLIDTINNYRQLYYSKNGKTEWKNQLSSLLQNFADCLHINEILTLIPDTCKRLIIIPHWFLHILPLHALPVSNSHFLKRGWEGAELHDLFPNGVQYAPSCQLLKIAQSFHHTDFNKLFAIQNPTKDLLFNLSSG